MKKKLIYIVLLIISFLLLSVFFFMKSDKRIKDENGNYTYICQAKFQNSKKKTIQTYKLKLNNDNQILSFYVERKYFYQNDIDYGNDLYTAGLMDVHYEGNMQDLTITIKSDDQPLVDENGNVITPDYREYMKQYIDENYQCDFEKK